MSELKTHAVLFFDGRWKDHSMSQRSIAPASRRPRKLFSSTLAAAFVGCSVGVTSSSLAGNVSPGDLEMSVGMAYSSLPAGQIVASKSVPLNVVVDTTADSSQPLGQTLYQ